eukprot:gene5477-6991_t
MDRYEAHLGTIFRKLHFANKGDTIIGILADNILQAKRQFQSPFKEEITPVLLADYVRELWISESPPQMDIDTVAMVDVLVDGGDIEQRDLDDHTKKKLFNIYRAIHYVTSDDSVGADSLTDASITEIYTVLAANSVIRATVNRRETVDIAVIHTEKTRRGSTKQCEPIAVHASKFLLICPFRNDNGRTARILLNAVLKSEVGVPFSLYVLSRDQYIEALEARNDMSPPSTLASYLLRAANKTSALLNWLAS